MSADRIVFLGHATVLIELDGVTVLTDPLLRGRVAHLRRQAPPIDRTLTASPDAVLISHLHRDHLDLPSLRILGRETRLLAPAGAGPWLQRHGFANVTELELGGTSNVGTLTVTAVRACHDGRRHPGGPSAETVGYLVRGRRAVYFAGDTELFGDMAGLSRQLDVALLPIWGWGPKLGPGHMDPLDAARAVALLQPRLAIPVHWGTMLPMTSTRSHREQLSYPAREFAEHVAHLAPEVEVRILTPGEETAL